METRLDFYFSRFHTARPPDRMFSVLHIMTEVCCRCHALRKHNTLSGRQTVPIPSQKTRYQLPLFKEGLEISSVLGVVSEIHIINSKLH
ncbi:hypothetical protein GYMLUDRAFT_599936 [Collybiopsis luxurians FD-317 M1]|uniref:Uncharacterized protein n=1 Tax=Collybiopsis luxurians FD-317 M1 TaxID=944289 RepID=A0A0D0CWU5_9AGAR|nr:hypothetical protein GYMLUDRAFT_599936 [Collybiopsis luxurians FD-317 M1]